MSAARNALASVLTVCTLTTFITAGAHESRRVHQIRCAHGHLGETRCPAPPSPPVIDRAPAPQVPAVETVGRQPAPAAPR